MASTTKFRLYILTWIVGATLMVLEVYWWAHVGDAINNFIKSIIRSINEDYDFRHPNRSHLIIATGFVVLFAFKCLFYITIYRWSIPQEERKSSGLLAPLILLILLNCIILMLSIALAKPWNWS